MCQRAADLIAMPSYERQSVMLSEMCVITAGITIWNTERQTGNVVFCKEERQL